MIKDIIINKKETGKDELK